MLMSAQSLQYPCLALPEFENLMVDAGVTNDEFTSEHVAV
jgi:hypothetical protein